MSKARITVTIEIDDSLTNDEQVATLEAVEFAFIDACRARAVSIIGNVHGEWINEFEKSERDAPVWFGADEAWAWASGWNAAIAEG